MEKVKKKYIAMSKEDADPLMEQFREEYGQWRKLCKEEKKGFFLIYNNFLTDGILKKLSGNSLRLYLYIGINSKNETGESWHSIEKICEYFECDKRSVMRWLLELEQNKLISRVQKGYRRASNTFLKPY